VSMSSLIPCSGMFSGEPYPTVSWAQTAVNTVGIQGTYLVIAIDNARNNDVDMKLSTVNLSSTSGVRT